MNKLTSGFPLIGSSDPSFRNLSESEFSVFNAQPQLVAARNFFGTALKCGQTLLY